LLFAHLTGVNFDLKIQVAKGVRKEGRTSQSDINLLCIKDLSPTRSEVCTFGVRFFALLPDIRPRPLFGQNIKTQIGKIGRQFHAGCGNKLNWNLRRQGRYFDRNAIEQLKSYFDTGTARVQAAATINANAAAIVKQSGSRLFEELPELIRPGGNAYTTVAMLPVCEIWTTTCATPPMRWLLAVWMC